MWGGVKESHPCLCLRSMWVQWTSPAKENPGVVGKRGVGKGLQATRGKGPPPLVWRHDPRKAIGSSAGKERRKLVKEAPITSTLNALHQPD